MDKTQSNITKQSRQRAWFTVGPVIHAFVKCMDGITLNIPLLFLPFHYTGIKAKGMKKFIYQEWVQLSKLQL